MREANFSLKFLVIKRAKQIIKANNEYKSDTTTLTSK